MEYKTKYPYDGWLREAMFKDCGFSACSWPGIGWFLAIFAFSFYYPIMYVFRKKGEV